MMGQKLFEILPDKYTDKVIGSTDVLVSEITIDSRQVSKGCIYAAFKGTTVDGHDYIKMAIDAGAKVIVCESYVDPIDDVVYITTKDVRMLTGILASKLYNTDQDNYQLIGVTGTNGKTTVATLLYQLYKNLGYKCGLISTVANRIGDDILPSTHTTPDIVNLHKLIAKMVDSDCKYIFMEVSSHAVDQQRIAGLTFDGAIFTNITQDHLDYHGTMRAYINAKKAFFDGLSKDAWALTNKDDANGMVMVQNCKAEVNTYGLKTMADFKTKVIESAVTGIHAKINEVEAHFRLIGEFNAYNLTAVFGAAKLMDANMEDVMTILTDLRGADGRFDQIVDTKTGKCAIVDYAHTPDALENVLNTILKVKRHGTKVTTVIGCGGDRDKGKRPIMAAIACKLSDRVILTSDNPRSESPEDILDDMMVGVTSEYKQKVLRITDRNQAIKTAVMVSGENDIILVAGKGHETYQEIKGEKFPFDDKKIVAEAFG
jgi:UDP-N-acetylmuramoyl-L-alanyl-D-glutamate--2,6-diaminopimelate ligase